MFKLIIFFEGTKGNAGGFTLSAYWPSGEGKKRNQFAELHVA